MGISWGAFAKKCPECGEKVYSVNPNKTPFCSKQCESNYKYRQRFAGDEKGSRMNPERLKKFKL